MIFSGKSLRYAGNVA